MLSCCFVHECLFLFYVSHNSELTSSSKSHAQFTTGTIINCDKNKCIISTCALVRGKGRLADSLPFLFLSHQYQQEPEMTSIVYLSDDLQPCTALIHGHAFLSISAASDNEVRNTPMVRLEYSILNCSHMMQCQSHPSNGKTIAYLSYCMIYK